MSKTMTKKCFDTWSLRIFVVLFVLMCGMAACSHVNEKLGLEDDHFVEEFTEFVISEKYDIDLDFTPRKRV